VVECADGLLSRGVRGGGGHLCGRNGRDEGARKRDRGMRRLVRWIEESMEGPLAGIGGWRMLPGRQLRIESRLAGLSLGTHHL
jgi:hypothetical protein